ncbi:MAG TPA: GNAT family N-acetyltransferase [Polyangia bacterium]|nr:GNAT family N-acetyltransferase [Polyangia bacterium]
MPKSGASEREQVIDILASSFETNPSTLWVVGPGPERARRIRHLMDYAYRCGEAQGRIWCAPPEEGLAAAIVTLPRRPAALLGALSRNLFFIGKVTGLGRLGAVLRRERYIRRQHPATDFAYLWFIGVRPEHQSRGHGRRLLHSVLAWARERSLPLYLETSVARNLAFYRAAGLEIYHQWDSELCGFPLWFLRSPA